ncbi:LysR substrate-binding domain-containing protein [Paracidovorax valerianellae]|uniref:DNA-binding transcriptional regulator, LysR family n=1 Tax=Paracidovorax valerianellae TaxID=187868 RepID=A0A1G6TVJ2_9BURK|nr:LysR substrate-binding domain-containing protein [Paracidovorax valerianellae]MDA8446934.1 LysR substrate-binding domain-containing protein [Paracidovorax valerianellae]SDD32476.1 DNA-binding transcriptional regulator, LysR family [Paracidovorax valerianellae]
MDIRLSASLLAWLRCFDAAARHGSFTKAAAELCITQGAVSQQVKQLEDWLSRPLFLRTPRALVPTPEGQWLAVVLRESFTAIESTLAQMRRPQETATATLSCSPSFAMSWLTPRLGEFFRQYPSMGLRVFGEFHRLDRTRMVRDGVEAAVRFDLGGYRDLNATVFLDEWLIPVASPEFLARHPPIIDAANLSSEWLLHDSSAWDGADAYEEWQHWFAQVGAAPPPWAGGQQFNLSQLALGAALAGQGIAMGRAALVLQDVRAGRLVPVIRRSVLSRAAYSFVTTAHPTPAMEQVREWLMEEGLVFCEERRQVLPAPQVHL